MHASSPRDVFRGLLGGLSGAIAASWGRLGGYLGGSWGHLGLGGLCPLSGPAWGDRYVRSSRGLLRRSRGLLGRRWTLRYDRSADLWGFRDSDLLIQLPAPGVRNRKHPRTPRGDHWRFYVGPLQKCAIRTTFPKTSKKRTRQNPGAPRSAQDRPGLRAWSP